MPTPKQVRHHYKKCRRYFYLLQCALNDAHGADVINYRRNEMLSTAADLPSVCGAVDRAKDNFEVATEQARAQAIRDECMTELRSNKKRKAWFY
jgi:hypothetical protein